MQCNGGFEMGKRKKKKKNKRVCLRCDREFMSEGIYNRVCPNCRESNANIALYPYCEDSISELFESGLDLALKSQHKKKKTQDEF